MKLYSPETFLLSKREDLFSGVLRSRTEGNKTVFAETNQG
jgi:hypothetical protein